jgi:hypothetical protein
MIVETPVALIVPLGFFFFYNIFANKNSSEATIILNIILGLNTDRTLEGYKQPIPSGNHWQAQGKTSKDC